MKVPRLVSWFGVIIIVLCAISISLAAEPINLMINPTFIDAETQIPPPSWNLYGSLDGGNSISVVNSDDPALRALRIIDAVAAAGEASAVGIVQEVSAVAGQTYRLKSLAKAVSDNSADWVVMQLRFLPSKTAYNLYLEAGTTNFEEFTIEEVAPVGTNKIAVYIFCNSWQIADVLLREVMLQVVETNPPTM